MYYVCALKSKNFNQTYTGFTHDLKSRFADHNAGRSKHTKKFRPWDLVTYTAFEDKFKARAYEKYLKTGSGIALPRRHLL